MTQETKETAKPTIEQIEAEIGRLYLTQIEAQRIFDQASAKIHQLAAQRNQMIAQASEDQ